MESSPPAGDRAAIRAAGGTELSWCRAVAGGTGITVLAFLLSQPIPLPLLRSSLCHLQLSHPLLRSLLPSPSAPQSTSIIIPTTPFREIDLFPPDLIPHPVSPFLAVVERELNRNTWTESAEARPVGSFFPSVYELREPGHSVIALRLHTGICDRTAGVAILKELASLIGGSEGEGEGAEEGEGEVGLSLEDLTRKDDAWKPIWVRGKDLVGYSLNVLRSTGLRFEDTSSNRRSEIVRLVVDAAATRRLLTVCNLKGIKLCSVLTAATFLATYSSKKLENNRPETYSSITLVDCRQDLNPPLNNGHIGFYHSAIFNTHTIREEDGFWEVAQRCHNAYWNAKKNKKHLSDIGNLNFLMCKAMENPQLTPSSSLRTALVATFEGIVDNAQIERLQGLGIDDYMGCSSVHGVGSSIAIFDTVRNGQLDCVCVYPSPLHSRNQMQELVVKMKMILIESCCVVEDGD